MSLGGACLICEPGRDLFYCPDLLRPGSIAIAMQRASIHHPHRPSRVSRPGSARVRARGRDCCTVAVGRRASQRSFLLLHQPCPSLSWVPVQVQDAAHPVVPPSRIPPLAMDPCQVTSRNLNRTSCRPRGSPPGERWAMMLMTWRLRLVYSLVHLGTRLMMGFGSFAEIGGGDLNLNS